MIDDDIIKEKIIQYRDDNNAIEDIKKYLSKYVYNYPRKIFHINHDRAIDFYIYYMERIERTFFSYIITDVKFITWLTYTLRSSYLNYIKEKTNKSKYMVSELSLDKPIVNSDGSTLYEIIASIDYNKSDHEQTDTIQRLSEDIQNKFKLPNNLIFEMHYLEIFMHFLIPSIMNYFNLNYDKSFELCQKARLTYLHKYQSFMQTQDRITIISSKIMLLEKNKVDATILKKLQERKQKYLKRLKTFRIVVPYSFLSKIFSIPENSITKIIIKIRNYSKMCFKNVVLK